LRVLKKKQFLVAELLTISADTRRQRLSTNFFGDFRLLSTVTSPFVTYDKRDLEPSFNLKNNKRMKFENYFF
jgi:hypothetical protein